jgi:hypothetical protein
VAIAAIDPDHPSDAVIVRGRVTEMTRKEGEKRLDMRPKKYLAEEEYPFRGPDKQRVEVHILPEYVSLASE